MTNFYFGGGGRSSNNSAHDPHDEHGAHDQGAAAGNEKITFLYDLFVVLTRRGLVPRKSSDVDTSAGFQTSLRSRDRKGPGARNRQVIQSEFIMSRFPHLSNLVNLIWVLLFHSFYFKLLLFI